MNKKIIVANLKSYMTLGETKNYLRIIGKKNLRNNVIFCPSSIYIPYFLDNDLTVGVQNISCFNCTGELTAEQAKSNNVDYCIIGHSERKILLKETDINKKVICSINDGLKVILCIGETKEEKNMFKTNSVIKRQLINYLSSLKPKTDIIIAYEPVWAIGTNIIPPISDIKEIVDYIKKISENMFDLDVKVLYGGSINSNNINLLNSIKNLDGFLIGKASTDGNEFLKILEVIDNQ